MTGTSTMSAKSFFTLTPWASEGFITGSEALIRLRGRLSCEVDATGYFRQGDASNLRAAMRHFTTTPTHRKKKKPRTTTAFHAVSRPNEHPHFPMARSKTCRDRPQHTHTPPPFLSDNKLTPPKAEPQPPSPGRDEISRRDAVQRTSRIPSARSNPPPNFPTFLSRIPAKKPAARRETGGGGGRALNPCLQPRHRNAERPPRTSRPSAQRKPASSARSL